MTSKLYLAFDSEGSYSSLLSGWTSKFLPTVMKTYMYVMKTNTKQVRKLMKIQQTYGDVRGLYIQVTNLINCNGTSQYT